VNAIAMVQKIEAFSKMSMSIACAMHTPSGGQ